MHGEFICITCGVQYSESTSPPERCLICEDPRQYVGPQGQEWTTLEEIKRTHRNAFSSEQPNLRTIVTEPKFAIGQRCFLVQGRRNNVLWECISLMDDDTVRRVKELGGVTAIAISHPHYYSALVEWSRALGGVPVYLHAADRQWVMRPDSCIQFWDGETKEIGDGLTLLRGGGHFEGGTMLHWDDGEGALLPGDIIQVCPDHNHVSFMRSYPNYVPLPANAVERVVGAVEPFEFDKVYGIWPGLNIKTGGKNAVRRSKERYLRALTEIV